MLVKMVLVAKHRVFYRLKIIRKFDQTLDIVPSIMQVLRLQVVQQILELAINKIGFTKQLSRTST